MRARHPSVAGIASVAAAVALAAARRTYRCFARLSRGTWTVTTTARGAAGVVAQGTRRVVVR